MNQREIAKNVKCGIATITQIARFLNQEKYGGYRNILKTLNSNTNNLHHCESGK